MKELLYILLLLPGLTNAQTNLDSLWNIWNDSAQADTSKLKAMKEISWDGYLFADPDSAFYFAQLQLDFAKEKGQKKYIANALNTQGVSFAIKGDYKEAIEYYKKSLKINEGIRDKSGVAGSLNNLGMIYYNQGDYAKAIEYYTKSLKVEDEIGDKAGIASSLNNIGNIYSDNDDNDKAMVYYMKSLKIREELEDKSGVSIALGNIGIIYKVQGDYAKAIEYCTKSLRIFQEIEDKIGIANSLNNIGTIYQEDGNLVKAIECHTKSLKIKEEINDKSGIAASLNNIGVIYQKQGSHNKALYYSERSLAIAEEIGNTLITKEAAKSLWQVNKQLGKPKESLEMYELYIAIRDSLDSEENQKAVIQQEFKYAYEKQAAADSVKAAEAVKVTDALLTAEKAENKQHQQQQHFLYAGLALALLFGAVIFNRFKIANKQKDIIEQQKQKVDETYDELEEAHREITDSINYAERIQRSFLATDELLNENLNEYFVYFNPKEAVSGDFYWAGKLSNGNFAMVNADSTGHGVPGAIMSILNVSSIEKAIEKNAVDPADIFNQTRKTIIERLKKDGSKDGGKDGMDASLTSFNSDKTKMTYVAAKNPIWIVRNNENGLAELIEIKPEKMPLGKHDNDHIPFHGGEFDIQKGDQIYTLTDGFQDQFGGPKGKKFMIKKMREYVLSISNLTMAEQHKCITEVFSNWKGDVEQVDDVCVIGVKI
ncbi:MAG: tetratricopeptide repeat protein [Flavobacteriales bacterium]|nr:tetratricopeptide repeat protein [Flavobacteriales bacterium]